MDKLILVDENDKIIEDYDDINRDGDYGHSSYDKNSSNDKEKEKKTKREVEEEEREKMQSVF